VTQRDDFWAHFMGKVPQGVFNKRFGVQVNCNLQGKGKDEASKAPCQPRVRNKASSSTAGSASLVQDETQQAAHNDQDMTRSAAEDAMAQAKEDDPEPVRHDQHIALQFRGVGKSMR
jgi:hypothetical protein